MKLRGFMAAATLIATLAGQALTARQHQERGIKYAKLGDWKNAEAELREAVNLAPNDPLVLATLGGVLGSEQKAEEAAGYLEKAVVLAPSNTEIRRNLAASQWQMGKLLDARTNLDQVLKANPADKQAVALLGAVASAFYAKGHTQNARKCLDVLSGPGIGSTAAFAAGKLAEDAGDFATAEKIFASIDNSYPDQALLRAHLASVQYYAGHFANCQATLTALIASGEADADAHNLLGWCLQKQGQVKEAVKELAQAIRLEPSKETHQLDLARMLLANADPVGALKITTDAVQVFPASEEAWSLKGSIEIGLQQFTDAVKSYSRAVSLNANEADPARALATSRWLAGSTKDAQESFDRLLVRFPKNASIYAAYGSLLVSDTDSQPEDVKRGAGLLETALSLDDSLADPHYQLGNLALTEGNLDAAMRYLEAAEKLNPSNSKVHFALSKAFKRQGRVEESAREMRAYQETKAAEDRSLKTPSK